MMDVKVPRTRRQALSVRENRTNLVAGRIPPVLVIVDIDLNVIGWSPNSDAVDIIMDSADELRDTVRLCCERRTQMVHIIDGDVLLRIVPLESYAHPFASIMIESFGHRGSLEKAAKAYGLTKREVEILSCVAQGMSNAEIGDGLYIAHSTVADHIKSLMRKTHTSKRIHLLSKIAYGEDVAV